MKLLYTLLICLFFHTTSLGQISPNKKNLVKLFKSSIEQQSKKSISVGSGAWTICNEDSAYFKSDTIKLYSNSNYFYQISSCCDFVNWTFYKKDAFIESYSQTCKEPASASVKTEYYNILVNKEKDKLYVQITNSKTLLGKFEVIRIENIKLDHNPYTQVIVLNRIKQKPI